MQERDIIQRTKSHKKWILALIERPTYLPLYRHLTLRPSYYTSLFLLWSQSVCRKREMANMLASTASLTNSLSTMSEIFSKAKQHFMKTQMRGFLWEFRSDSRRLNYSHKMSDKWWCTGSTLFRWLSYQIECILFSPNFATRLAFNTEAMHNWEYSVKLFHGTLKKYKWQAKKERYLTISFVISAEKISYRF